MSLVSVGIVRKARRSDSEFINVIAAERDQAKEQIIFVSNELFLNSLYLGLSSTNLIVPFHFICRFGALVLTSQLLLLTDPLVFPLKPVKN